jgi:hypothetical protein
MWYTEPGGKRVKGLIFSGLGKYTPLIDRR